MPDHEVREKDPSDSNATLTNWRSQNVDWLEKDVATLRSALDEFHQIVEELPEEVLGRSEEAEFRDRLDHAWAIIEASVEHLKESLKEREPKDPSTHIFLALSAVGVLDAETAWLNSRLASAANTHPIAAKAAGWLSNHLGPLLRRIAARLWQVLACMLTPKSWTVHGEAGAGLFGLGGKVGISITFGP